MSSDNQTTTATPANGQTDALRELHSLLVQAMAAKLKSGEEVKASYLDTVRKFLLDNDVRVENPQEYLGYLQGMMSAGGDHSNANDDDDDDPIYDPLGDIMKNAPRTTGAEETYDGYGFQR